MKKRHSWIPFYKELAYELRTYNTDTRRKNLASFANKVNALTGYDGPICKELDPFSIFGFISRPKSFKVMVSVWELTKQEFHLKTEIPNPAGSIPTLRNHKFPCSFRNEDVETINLLWKLFDAALDGDSSNVSSCLYALSSKQIDIEYLSRDLAWVAPYQYLPITAKTISALTEIKVINNRWPPVSEYMNLMASTIKELKKGASLIDFYQEANLPEGGPRIWLVGSSIDDVNCSDQFINDNKWTGIFSNSSVDKQQMSLLESIKEGDIFVLKSTFTKGTSHNIPVLRVSGIGIVKYSNIKFCKSGQDKCTVSLDVDFLPCPSTDFEGPEFGSYRRTVQEYTKGGKLAEFVRSIALDEELTQVQAKVNNPMLQPYIKLLEANKNLVITGAPGTGKTYLAKQIAKEMMGITDDKDLTIVQFHPSYDYTDFVEGLRPMQQDGQIVFQREDGIFKAFCKMALANFTDAKKSQSELNEEEAARKVLGAFVADSIADEIVFKTQSNKDFKIVSENNNSIQIHIPQNEITHHIGISKKELLKLLIVKPKVKNSGDVWNFFSRKYRTQQDTYLAALYQAMRNKVEHVTVPSVEEKKFVFLIDEINRGDLSKILGDLFYSIDPGYRGKDKCCIKTQYQNLVDSDDEFGAGFFVPENVYILATMNDIDRSVESMDFAIRRRFAWKEVLAADTMYMLDGLTKSDEAKKRLNALNEEIEKDETLGTAYQIGASFMLKLPLYNYDFDALWQMHIEGTLKEYTRGMRNQKEKMESFKKAYDLQ